MLRTTHCSRHCLTWVRAAEEGGGAWRQEGRESRKMGRGEQRDQQAHNKSGKEEKGEEREERGEKGREKCIGKPQGHIRVA